LHVVELDHHYQGAAVKGLIFNLLDAMARQSGCADEAWDLVMEFVASENASTDAADSCLSEFSDRSREPQTLEASIDAVLQSLGAESEDSQADLLDLPRLPEGDRSYRNAASLSASDLAPLGRDTAYSEGFSHDLLSLLEQLLAEALVDDDDEDVSDDCSGSVAPPRRSGG
jgi:hypothetical protein